MFTTNDFISYQLKQKNMEIPSIFNIFPFYMKTSTDLILIVFSLPSVFKKTLENLDSRHEIDIGASCCQYIEIVVPNDAYFVSRINFLLQVYKFYFWMFEILEIGKRNKDD